MTIEETVLREADIGPACTCQALPENERPCPAHKSIIEIVEAERERCVRWAEQHEYLDAESIIQGIRSGDPVT